MFQILCDLHTSSLPEGRIDSDPHQYSKSLEYFVGHSRPSRTRPTVKQDLHGPDDYVVVGHPASTLRRFLLQSDTVYILMFRSSVRVYVEGRDV
jgi:hypothetical protein